jgi:hypothetical protein
MPARPATINDIPEVLRLAALMYATIGQHADEDWFREAGRLLETRMGEGPGELCAKTTGYRTFWHKVGPSESGTRPPAPPVRWTDTKLGPVSRSCALFATNFGAEPDTHAGAAVGVWQRL